MRKRALAIALSLAVLAGAGVAHAQTAQEYWPVTQGNECTYVIEGATQSGQKFDVKVTQRSGGWAFLDGVAEFHGAGWGDRWWWMSGVSGSIWTWNPTLSSYSRVFDLALPRGGTFTSEILDVAPCLDGALWEVAERSATRDTAVGTFTDCLVIRVVQPVCYDAGLTHMVFAPGVGPIEYGWTTFAGGHTAKLIGAHVDGVDYQQQAVGFGGLSTALALDRFRYELVEDREPPVPPTGPPLRPATLRLRFELRNDAQQAVTYDYGSTQRYELVIRDRSGAEVYRWSANKRFAMAAARATLQPGDALVYEETFELRATAGGPLPEGEYLLEAVHTTSPAATRNTATVRFEIVRVIAN